MYIPPYYPPKGKKASDYTGIDFSVLLKEFALSEKLRGMYSFAKVVSMYDAIKRGDFRDKKDETTEAANARADRDRHYSALRAKAETKVESVYACMSRDLEFLQADKRLRCLEFEIAKAEVAKDEENLAELLTEKGTLKVVRLARLEANGFTEEDLKPKYYCDKCNDTGYLPNSLPPSVNTFINSSPSSVKKHNAAYTRNNPENTAVPPIIIKITVIILLRFQSI